MRYRLLGTRNCKSKDIESAQGSILLQICQESRNSGHFDTAYSSILAAIKLDTKNAYFERAKWAWSKGLKHQAIQELKVEIEHSPIVFDNEASKFELAQKRLMYSRWVDECQALHSSAVMLSYIQVTKDFPQ